MMFNKVSKQFVRFCFVGFFATTVNYSIFYLMIIIGKYDYTLSSMVGFLSGVIAGFPFNKSWAFKDTIGNWKKQILLYLAVYMSSLVMSLILLKILVIYFGMDPKIANIFCICLTICTNFIGTKLFIFRG